MRAILKLRPSQGGPLIDLEEGVLPIPETFAPGLLAVDPAHPDLLTFQGDAEGGGRTGAIGDLLFQAITGNSHVAKQVEGALLQKAPIYLNDPSPAAQMLPWETLRAGDGGGFVGLSNQLRLARMVLTGAPGAIERQPFAGELRILAVLAAAGGDPNNPANPPITALDEWKALLSIQNHLPPGVTLRIDVLGCDQEVKTAVEQAGAASAAATPPFTFTFLPPQEKAEAALLAAANAAPLHFVHFFCHGFGGDSPFLELATASDQLKGSARGSVLLEIANLARLRAAGAWGVLLNCCSGAEATENSQGLARGLVAEAGFSAVIGMQEPIDRRDAHRFCAAFYASLLRHLGRGLAAPPVRIDWPEVLIEPRQRLCQAHVQLLSKAGDSKPWSLPVLYVRPQIFELEVTQASPPGATAERAAAEAEIATLTVLLAELTQAGTPAAVLDGIRKRIADLRAANP